jgi:hypothetical protein
MEAAAKWGVQIPSQKTKRNSGQCPSLCHLTLQDSFGGELGQPQHNLSCSLGWFPARPVAALVKNVKSSLVIFTVTLLLRLADEYDSPNSAAIRSATDHMVRRRKDWQKRRSRQYADLEVTFFDSKTAPV